MVAQSNAGQVERMKTGKPMYAVLGAVAAFMLAALIVIGFLGDRMPERQDGKTALGKPLSEQQQTARRRATITAVGAVTAM
nr:hypothetical protein [Sphingomonas melonis]